MARLSEKRLKPKDFNKNQIFEQCHDNMIDILFIVVYFRSLINRYANENGSETMSANAKKRTNQIDVRAASIMLSFYFNLIWELWNNNGIVLCIICL